MPMSPRYQGSAATTVVNAVTVKSGESSVPLETSMFLIAHYAT
jgi:hypothetical protein